MISRRELLVGSLAATATPLLPLPYARDSDWKIIHYPPGKREEALRYLISGEDDLPEGFRYESIKS